MKTRYYAGWYYVYKSLMCGFALLLSPVCLCGDDMKQPGKGVIIEHFWHFGVADCLREQIREIIKTVPDSADAAEWKEDWSGIIRECESVEIEMKDSRRINDGALGDIEFVNADKPKMRVILPLIKSKSDSKAERRQSRVIPLITANIEGIEIKKGENGKILSKIILVGIEWKVTNGNGIRSGAAHLTDYAFASFTITIHARDKH